MLTRLENKTALVCASTRGLGFGSAVALGRLGARVIINGRSQATVDAAIDQLAGLGIQATGAPGDVASAQGRKAILSAVGVAEGAAQGGAQEEGACAIDILVNNAGGPPPGSYEDWSGEDWHHAIEQNMVAPILLAKAVLPAMSAKGWGRIVNITSASVRAPIAHLGLSNGARAGLTGAMAGIARQVAADGVTINNVLPGPHETDRLRQNYQAIAKRANTSTQAAWEAGKQRHPTKCFGQAEDFGAVVAFLCTDQAKFIVGQNIVVDGGAANITI